jgi:hypothetical protein
MSETVLTQAIQCKEAIESLKQGRGQCHSKRSEQLHDQLIMVPRDASTLSCEEEKRSAL